MQHNILSDLYREFEGQFPKVEKDKLRSIIDVCINYKIKSFHRFLLTKI